MRRQYKLLQSQPTAYAQGFHVQAAMSTPKCPGVVLTPPSPKAFSMGATYGAYHTASSLMLLLGGGTVICSHSDLGIVVVAINHHHDPIEERMSQLSIDIQP